MIWQLQSRCWLCHLPLVMSHHGICWHCLKLLPEIPQSCFLCSLPTVSQKRCFRCRNKPPPWHVLIAVSPYSEPLKSLVHRLKFSRHIELSYALARLLLLKWLTFRRQFGLMKPDIVLIVPLFHHRQWQRGFNQIAPLAKLLAHWLGSKFDPDLLVRSTSTISQKTLSAYERRQNLCHAFYCRRSLEGKRILLVDDIVTTGSTLREICLLLTLHGAIEVQTICLCRTL